LNQPSREFEDMSGTDIIKLIVSIVACEGAGGIGAIFTTRAIPTWYAGLKKPSFTPPNSVFGPIWITLYVLMGIAVFFVWREGLGQEGVAIAFAIFWVQLVLNILWSVIFFGFKSLFGGMVIILLLWIAILINIITFFGVSPLASWLLIPYIIWVSIAVNLNVQVWKLNR
jgi:benzodiazapine receptor